LASHCQAKASSELIAYIFECELIKEAQMPDKKKVKHIKLTSHPGLPGSDLSKPIKWGAATPAERGAIVATVTEPAHRNAIGTHSGSYTVYRALAVAAGELNAEHRPDLTNTAPAEPLTPHPQWKDPYTIVSIDPWGADISRVFSEDLKNGYDIRPTIAVTKAHINMPELKDALAAGRLKADGKILTSNGDCVVTKAAIEPVWWLPGIAKRFNVEESELRRILFEQTGGMYPELVTRPDLEVFLPPIGSLTVYFFGDVTKVGNPNVEHACRVHDECNGSDVFGSDICTCRPYLAHGIEVAIESAQRGGVGVIVYSRKEGRALGEVTKFLVYNARKRQEGGDTADKYFARTECVAGVQDMRFQQLMPDVLHWLGITKIDHFVSMSNLKYDAITGSGIKIINRIQIPEELVPADAQVEMDAKKAAGYFTATGIPTDVELKKAKGRSLTE
jgi:GTP cyclohydrolase II